MLTITLCYYSDNFYPEAFYRRLVENRMSNLCFQPELYSTIQRTSAKYFDMVIERKFYEKSMILIMITFSYFEDVDEILSYSRYAENKTRNQYF